MPRYDRSGLAPPAHSAGMDLGRRCRRFCPCAPVWRGPCRLYRLALVLQGQPLARANQPSQISTLPVEPTSVPTPAYVVVIATSPAAADTPAAGSAPGEQTPAVAQAGAPDAAQLTPAFPEAVTPTPIIVAPPVANGQPVTTQPAGESASPEMVPNSKLRHRQICFCPPPSSPHPQR
ncbi:MAG: hypothetical protein R3E79_40145 [Caldilineaceae bacterium]